MSEQEKGRRSPSIVLLAADPLVAELVRLRLWGAGCEPRTAATASAALERIREAPPDLVILDDQVPQIGPAEVETELTRHWPDRRVPILLLAAAPPTEQPDEPPVGPYATPRDHLLKPFDPDQLVQRVFQLLERHR